MNKYIKIISFLLLTLKITIIGQGFDTSVITDASYYIWQEIVQPTSPEDFSLIDISFLKLENCDKKQRYYYKMHYYTFDGDLLVTVNFSTNYHFDYVGNNRYYLNCNLHNEFLRKKIDLSSRKPQPTYYKIVCHDDNVTRGYRIYFYDKHNNELQWYWYDSLTFNKQEYVTLDLSRVQDRTVMTDEEKRLFLMQRFDRSVIKNASYYICKEIENDQKNSSAFPSVASFLYREGGYFKGVAEYYTFNGEWVAEINFSHGGTIYNELKTDALDKKLDPQAPKPQPAYYQIRYVRLKNGTGYLIEFYDKHINFMKRIRYDDIEKTIGVKEECYKFPLDRSLFNQLYPDFPFDLTMVKEKEVILKTKSKISNFFKELFA